VWCKTIQQCNLPRDVQDIFETVEFVILHSLRISASQSRACLLPDLHEECSCCKTVLPVKFDSQCTKDCFPGAVQHSYPNKISFKRFTILTTLLKKYRIHCVFPFFVIRRKWNDILSVKSENFGFGCTIQSEQSNFGTF
jgi:hypothetical protein